MAISKNVLLKIVNPLLGIAFVLQMASGYLMGQGSIFYEIHENCAIALIVLALAHIVLNWNWIKANFLTRKASRSS